MKNEFGEKISLGEIHEFTEKISMLSEQEIDEFFKSVGWIEEERGSNLSISKKKIEVIKRKGISAEKIIRTILTETPIKEFSKELNYLLLKKRQ